jgi:hypothetical protein
MVIKGKWGVVWAYGFAKRGFTITLRSEPGALDSEWVERAFTE